MIIPAKVDEGGEVISYRLHHTATRRSGRWKRDAHNIPQTVHYRLQVSTGRRSCHKPRHFPSETRLERIFCLTLTDCDFPDEGLLFCEEQFLADVTSFLSSRVLGWYWWSTDCTEHWVLEPACTKQSRKEPKHSKNYGRKKWIPSARTKTPRKIWPPCASIFFFRLRERIYMWNWNTTTSSWLLVSCLRQDMPNLEI